MEASIYQGGGQTDRQAIYEKVFGGQGNQVVSSRRVPSVVERLGVLLTVL
jgi:hypothetical protein